MKVNCCWLYAISRYGYPPTPQDTARAIRDMAAMGFTAVELEGVREANLREVHAARRELKRLCDGLGLEIMNFCPILPDVVSPDVARRRRGVDLFELGLETACFLGATLVQVDTFTPPLRFRSGAPYRRAIRYGERYEVRIPAGFSWARQWGALTDGIGRCKRLANRAGLTLLVEPRVGEIVSNTDGMLRLIEAVGRKGFGAVLDTGHQHAQKELLPLSVMKLGNAVRYVHASDNLGLTNEHRAIGDGAIDWTGVFEVLRRVGFTGWIGVDVGGVPRLQDAYRRSRRALLRLGRAHGL